jgi:hypothetical protein
MTDNVAYELTIDPSVGDSLQIPGLGTFDPGKTYEISKEEADSYRSFWTRNGELGATLLQNSKKMYGVTVTTPKSGGSDDKQDDSKQEAESDKQDDSKQEAESDKQDDSKQEAESDKQEDEGGAQ